MIKNKWTGVMDNWTEWHQLTFEELLKMGEEEHKLYCKWWLKAHPINMKKLSEGLLIGMSKISHVEDRVIYMEKKHRGTNED